MENKKNMKEIMKERNYDLVGLENNNQYTFLNEEKHVICIINTVTKRWHLIYTNKNICGYLDSGEFGNYMDDLLFNKVQSEFMLGVEQLSKLDNVVTMNSYQE